jgi:hypothetical protein
VFVKTNAELDTLLSYTLGASGVGEMSGSRLLVGG